MTHKPPLRTSLFFLLVMFLTACGTKLIRGEAPVVRMNELSHANNSISLQLSLRNLNGVALDVEHINLSLSVRGTDLFSYDGPADTNIAPNGTEIRTLVIAENSSSRQLLDTLQNGDIKSLPYSLEGSITSVDDGKLKFQHTGHIYPVPGRPGHFR